MLRTRIEVAALLKKSERTLARSRQLYRQLLALRLRIDRLLESSYQRPATPESAK